MKYGAQRALTITVIIAAVAAGSLTALAWWRSWNPSFMDSGPYAGIPRNPPQGTPIQIFQIWDGNTLLIYPALSTNTDPIVALKDKTGRIQWSIEAKGKTNCHVASLRFDAYSVLAWKSPRIVGLVDWNCGGIEKMVWKLERDGTLKEYWYSW